MTKEEGSLMSARRMLAGPLAAVVAAGAIAAGAVAQDGAAEGKTFAYIPHLTGHPVWLIAKEGWDANAAENGFEGQWIGSTSGEVTELVTALDAAIVQGVDGIAIAAINESAMGPSIDRAVEAGIPVVTILADAADSQRQAFLGTDTTEAGQRAAQGLIEATGGEGEVGVIVGGFDIPNQAAILEAFKQELAAKAPDMTIVAEEQDNSDLQISVEKVAAILTAHPDLKGLFGINANVAPAACSVFKERGITAEQVAMIGFDDLEETLACIRDGTIYGSMAQNFYGAGYLAGDLLTKLSNGESVDEVNDSGVALVTLDTIDSYSTDFRDYGN
jgi:ABC-type sugar transport system substrate-binding protein